MQKITPFLWFGNQAEEAAHFYASVFKNSKITSISRYGESGEKASGMPKGSAMTVAFNLNGQEFVGLNGGPIFKFSEAISFFVYCKTEHEVNELYNKLSPNGQILMPLDKYPFSEKYAFIKDKFGVAWQIILSPSQPNHIAPSLLFVGKDLGKAEAAVKFYTKVFKNTNINHMSHYEKGENGKAGTVKHSSFFLEGQEFVAMDGTGPHKFTFNESISFVINCDTQEEVDYFWKNLTEGGKEVQCGWLKDKYGASWQVVPIILTKLLQDKDPKKSERVMKAMLQMHKIDIKALKQAYDQK